VIGYMSPFPMVVGVMTTHHIVAGMLENKETNS
jgi:hypothetical protein